MEEYKLAKDAEIFKFENENDAVEGYFVSCEQSQKYPESWAVTIQTGDKPLVCFVNNIVKQKLEIEDIKKGQQIKIVFKGKQKSASTGMEYNNFDLYYV